MSVDSCASRFQRATGATCITLRRTRRVIGWCGGHEGWGPRKTVGLTLVAVARALRASCLLTFAVVGNVKVRMKGVPIGGMMSRICAAVYLGDCEAAWAEDTVKHRLYGFASSVGGGPLSEALRYVDDVAVSSRSLCRNCLLLWAVLTYGHLQFSWEPEAFTVPWLDLLLTSAEGKLHIEVQNVNRPWLLGTGPRVKRRYLPWLGGPMVRFAHLRAQLLGRLRRFEEMQLAAPDVANAMAEEIRELLMEGYPWSYIRAIVHSLGTEAACCRSLRAAVRSAIRSLDP